MTVQNLTAENQRLADKIKRLMPLSRTSLRQPLSLARDSRQSSRPEAADQSVSDCELAAVCASAVQNHLLFGWIATA